MIISDISKADYILLNVGYGYRLLKDFSELDEDLKSIGVKIVMIGNNDRSLVVLENTEFGESINFINSLLSEMKLDKITFDGLLIKGDKNNGYKVDFARTYNIIEKIIELRHCACLCTVPYKIQECIYEISNKNINVLVLSYDTESG